MVPQHRLLFALVCMPLLGGCAAAFVFGTVGMAAGDAAGARPPTTSRRSVTWSPAAETLQRAYAEAASTMPAATRSIELVPATTSATASLAVVAGWDIPLWTVRYDPAAVARVADAAVIASPVRGAGCGVPLRVSAKVVDVEWDLVPYAVHAWYVRTWAPLAIVSVEFTADTVPELRQTFVGRSSGPRRDSPPAPAAAIPELNAALARAYAAGLRSLAGVENGAAACVSGNNGAG